MSATAPYDPQLAQCSGQDEGGRCQQPPQCVAPCTAESGSDQLTNIQVNVVAAVWKILKENRKTKQERGNHSK